MKTYAIGRKRAFLNGSFMGGFSTLAFGAVLGVLWYGGYMVIKDKLSVGELSSFILYTITMSVGLVASGGVLNQMITAVGVAEKLFELMDEPISIKSGDIKPNQPLIGEIEFQNVVFEYPTKQ